MEIEEMKENLARRLKPSRYRHSLGVSETAGRLAQRFGVSIAKAQLAGLLHDCAREFAITDMIKVAKAMQIPFTAVEATAPILLHAYIGAKMLPEAYGVADAEVRQAIHRHTVGGPAMTDLDKIVYLADMIEPNRQYPGVDELRRLAETAPLDQVMLAAFNRSIAFVLSQNNVIHPDTVIARNEILIRE